MATPQMRNMAAFQSRNMTPSQTRGSVPPKMLNSASPSPQDKMDNKMRNSKLRIKLGFMPDVGGPRAVTPSTASASRPTTQDAAHLNAPRTTLNTHLETALGPTLEATLNTLRETTFKENPNYDEFAEEYETANRDIQKQYDLIGRIRNEIPLIERDEVDSGLLGDLAKVLEVTIFPVSKMMHIDPKAVKRMMDEQFRKAYGLEVEEEIARDITPAIPDEADRDGDGKADVGIEEPPPAAPAVRINTRGKAKADKTTEAAEPDHEPPKKRPKRGSLRGAQKEVDGEVHKDTATVPAKKPAKKRDKKEEEVDSASLSEIGKQNAAYRAKRKKAKKGCRIATIRSQAAVERWEELEEQT